MVYSLVRPLLFRMDAEKVHHRLVRLGTMLQQVPLVLPVLRSIFTYQHPALHVQVDGVAYENPIGLAAGFDKNGEIPRFMSSFGFGHVEIGSVTSKQHTGNPKPRVHRVIEEQALVINYGLANHGAATVKRRIAAYDEKMPIGISIAKTPRVGGEQGIRDYAQSFRDLSMHGTYTTINISCPNVADGETYGENPRLLRSLLQTLSKEKIVSPVYLKLKPDYSHKQIDDILEVINSFPFVKGVIIGNLTKERKGAVAKRTESGGISGKPTRNKSTALIRYVYKKTNGQLTIIGCGGIFTAQDAYDKITSGASMLQLITGMIYLGPSTIRNINKGLVTLLEQDGFKSITEATGSRA
ncbi:quinone-dependent dihydroorotate dehydrogenase [Candidatus Woesearchaeota archaeon]|nr:quinone-dependent dihydroorotate dehydrogenase [Candidatus Woesearchaeota archaeon]